jgi:nitrite reductase/ring-hydroxylating ferredoxin subunit
MPQEELGRRAVLVGAGCGVLALLGACSSGGGSDQQAAPAAALPDGALANVADVPVGGGVVSAAGVLVLQLRAGQFTAFDAACPHQGVRVSPPDSSGVITCHGHNSHFKAADGSLMDGPAPSGLTPVAVTVSGEEIVRA